MARLATGLLVNALIRLAEQSGGSAMVLAKGEVTAGAILLLTLERGQNPRFFERGLGPDGKTTLIVSGPKEMLLESDVTDYWKRRRSRDEDLWVLELDIPDGERFAAQLMVLD